MSEFDAPHRCVSHACDVCGIRAHSDVCNPWLADHDAEDKDVVRLDWTPTHAQMAAYKRREVELARANLSLWRATNPQPNVCAEHTVKYIRVGYRMRRIVTNGLEPGHGYHAIGVVPGTVTSPQDVCCSAYTLAQALR